jgi:hypothetical protein
VFELFELCKEVAMLYLKEGEACNFENGRGPYMVVRTFDTKIRGIVHIVVKGNDGFHII